MKIISFSNEIWEREYISSRLPGHEIAYYEGTVQDNEGIRDDSADVLSVFVKSSVGPAEMDRFPNIKLITTRSTGFDHIDLDEAKKRGIIVSTVPTYGMNTVAEYAFALLLTLSRRIYESYDRVVETGSFSQEGLRGFDLRGKKIGIVGTGNIGRHAIQMAKGFGMEVIAFDVNEDKQAADDLGFMYVTLPDLFSQSDIISMHAPYNEHTHHMINSDNLHTLKHGTYIINTARGGLIETKALIRGLEEGIIAGAGLDVVEEENFMRDDLELLLEPHPNPESLQTLLANQYLIDHPRVIIVPHNAFNTQEAIERILNTTIENIKAFANGEPQNDIIARLGK